MKRNRTREGSRLSEVTRRLVLLAFLLAASQTASGQERAPAPVSPEWAARWRADLAFVAETLPVVHANLFHSVSREHFTLALDSLAARVPSLAHPEIVTELARIVALVGDGHTRLTLPFDSGAGFFTGHSTTPPPRIPGLVFRHLPVRFDAFADGLFVTRASFEWRELMGSRVVRIGEMTVDQAMAAVTPTVHHDNDQQLSQLLPLWLGVPEILHARGVIASPERVTMELEDDRGARRTVALSPVSLGATVEWVDAVPGDSIPLMRREPGRRHWFVQLPGTKTVYARYREVLDDEDQSVASFAQDLFGYIADHQVERLVLDIRGNVGGNGFLNAPVVRGIVRAKPLWEPGGLFVLIDRGTFSAALMLAVELERQTPAIFVGEPTGGRPNGYGDSRRVRLPETGLTIRASTLFWQLSDPRDEREALTPHVQVPATFGDYRAGRDAVVDTVLAIVAGASAPAGVWNGTLGVEHQRLSARLCVASRGGAWSGTIAVPATAEAVALADARVGDGELSFQFPIGGGTAQARVRGGTWSMPGTVELAGAVFPLVLFRSTGASPDC